MSPEIDCPRCLAEANSPGGDALSAHTTGPRCEIAKDIYIGRQW